MGDDPPPREPGRKRGGPGPRPTGLRGLVGGGPSRVGPGGAMRARDVSRPGQEDLDAAARDLVIHFRPGPPPGERALAKAVPTPGAPAPTANMAAPTSPDAPPSTALAGPAGERSTALARPAGPPPTAPARPAGPPPTAAAGDAGEPPPAAADRGGEPSAAGGVAPAPREGARPSPADLAAAATQATGHEASVPTATVSAAMAAGGADPADPADPADADDTADAEDPGDTVDGLDSGDEGSPDAAPTPRPGGRRMRRRRHRMSGES